MLLLRCFCFLTLALAFALPAPAATVLVLRFHNNSQYPELSWVGESISETLKSEFSRANEIVLDRAARAEGMQRLGLRADANFTKATLVRLGQSLDADYVVYGSYEAKLPPGDSQLKDSSVELTAHFLDLRKLHEGPDISEAGKLADLSRYQEHMAWESLKYLDPQSNRPLDAFMAPEKLTRLDADESYIRGLLATDKDQQQKWFLQAANLDPHFTDPAYELGKLYLDRKDYRQSLKWLLRIPASDPRYPETRFRMGLDAYGAGDYGVAVSYFREVAALMPLNEVYNNLGAAEEQLRQPNAIDDYRKALEGDPNDATYLFNLGAALLRNNSFDEAAKDLEAVSDNSPEDEEAAQLLARAKERQAPAQTQPAAGKPMVAARLKSNFDTAAFEQLKAMLQPKSKP